MLPPPPITQDALRTIERHFIKYNMCKGRLGSRGERVCISERSHFERWSFLLYINCINIYRWSSPVNHRDYSCSSDCQRSSPVKQSTNHSHRNKAYRFPAFPSLHWRTGTNQLWSDHRFGLVSLVEPDMRSA